MSQTFRSAPAASLFLLVILSALVAPSFSKILLDYRVPLTAKVADLGVKTSALGKLTNAVITGKNTIAEAYEFLKPTTGKFQHIVMKINDNSIFKDQVGFRRNDIVPNYDAKSIETGKKTYHHSFIFTKNGNLNQKHGYLLGSVEFPNADGTHIYDIHWGTEFSKDNVAGTESKDANKIRVRDINFKTVFQIDQPVVLDTVYNFAVEVDWDKNTLAVHHSLGNDKLKEVVPAQAFVPTNPKAKKVATTGEWHIQIIKDPLPNPKDSPEDRNDVPHKGIQETNIKEQIIHLRNFIEDTPTTNPDGPDADAGTKATDASRKKTGKP